MNTLTEYLWFETKQRQETVRITDQVAEIVRRSGVAEGMVLVSAMHITAAVFVNDWEDGLIHDFQVWLETLAPGHRRRPLEASLMSSGEALLMKCRCWGRARVGELAVKASIESRRVPWAMPA